MNKLEFILFNVGHGLSAALIELPEKYVTVIDLGSEGDFSPLKYLSLHRGLMADVLYVSHPHGDHISDVETASLGNYRPLSVYCQDYNWNDVIERERRDLREKVRRYVEFINTVPRGTYSGSAHLSPWRWSPDNAISTFGEGRYINNSSLFLIYQWRDFKISVAGDHETDAMVRLCNHGDFINQAKDTDILVAPHHGHAEGYTGLWPQRMGKPYITLISIQSRDQNVAPGYASDDFAKGITFRGKPRYCITTRSDGNISVKMYYDSNGKATWNFEVF